jgi:hypoxanthine phosphoribosyltransferase
MIEGWKKEYGNSNVIIVDDIMDTGNTFDAILYGEGRNGSDFKAQFFTLVKKHDARFVNFKNYFAQVPSDVWVQFPWEQEGS